MRPLSMGREDSSDSLQSFKICPLSEIRLPSVRFSTMQSSLFYCPLSLDWELLRDSTSVCESPHLLCLAQRKQIRVNEWSKSSDSRMPSRGKSSGKWRDIITVRDFLVHPEREGPLLKKQHGQEEGAPKIKT